MRVTIILLNCRRPENIEYLMARYPEMECVEEVIVWSTPPGDYKSTHPKVRTASCHQEWGMFPRYMLAMLAKTDAVLSVDDDLFIPEASIKAMMETWRDDRMRIIGIGDGRGPDANGNYSSVPISTCKEFMSVEIIVGRAALFYRDFGVMAIQSTRHTIHGDFNVLYSNAVALGVHPSQMEDILLSYSAMARSCRTNIALNLPFEELPCPHAICERPNHYEYRNIAMKFCRKFFMIE